MKTLKTNWLIKHALTVFSCVLIIVFGIVFLSQADPVTTTIGENIVTNDLSVTGNVTSGTWQGTAIGTQYGGTGADWSAVAQGNIPYFSSAGTLSNLAPGTAGQFLKSQGTGADPEWGNVTRSATFVVAASDSSTLFKQQADYVCDGTDDQVEINTAINLSFDKVVQLTSGTYNISSPIILWDATSAPYSVWLRGSGQYITWINSTVNSDFNAIENIQSGTPAEFRKVSDLGINFATPSAGNGIYAYNGSSGKAVFDFHMMNLSISNAKGYGIYLDGSAPTWGTKIENCWIEYNLGGGIYAKSQQSYFSNNFVAYNRGVGILLPTGSKRVYLLNNNVSLNYSQNFSISGSHNEILGGSSVSWGQDGTSRYGIYLNGFNHVVDSVDITGDGTKSWAGIALNSTSHDNSIMNCKISGVTTYGIVMTGATVPYNNIIIGNHIAAPIPILYTVRNQSNIIRNNIYYIDSGELRTASGSLTAGSANAIGFAWHDPELQDIYIKKVIISITTPGGTAGSHLDIGIADDANGTNKGVEFFNDIDLNAAAIVDSTIVAGGGTQTVWVFCQDNASVTDGWVVGQILDANASNLTGNYYIEYVGK